MSCHLTLCHVTSRHLTSRHVTSRHVTSRHVTTRRVISCRIMACYMQCHVKSLPVRSVRPCGFASLFFEAERLSVLSFFLSFAFQPFPKPSTSSSWRHLKRILIFHRPPPVSWEALPSNKMPQVSLNFPSRPKRLYVSTSSDGAAYTALFSSKFCEGLFALARKIMVSPLQMMIWPASVNEPSSVIGVIVFACKQW